MSFALPKVSNSAGMAVPEGLYLVTLKAMEKEYQESGPYGPQDRVKWIFTIDEVLDSNDDEAENKVGEELWAFTSLSMGKKAKMRAYAEALFGRQLQENEEITVSDLIGKRAKVTVIPHTKQDGSETTKVGSLVAAKTKKRAAAALNGDEDDLF